jgi:hypothetical protein
MKQPQRVAPEARLDVERRAVAEEIGGATGANCDRSHIEKCPVSADTPSQSTEEP